MASRLRSRTRWRFGGFCRVRCLGRGEGREPLLRRDSVQGRCEAAAERGLVTWGFGWPMSVSPSWRMSWMCQAFCYVWHMLFDLLLALVLRDAGAWRSSAQGRGALRARPWQDRRCRGCVVVFGPNASYCCSGVLRFVRTCGPPLGQHIQGGLSHICVGGQGTAALRRRGAGQVFTSLGAEVEAAGG